MEQSEGGIRRINVLTIETADDAEDPEGYRARMARFGPQIAARMLGGSVYDLPAGQAVCPYHYEYGNEEWLLVLSGRPTLRHPGGEAVLAPGDLVCFPEGPDGAHRVVNGADQPVRILMVSTNREPSVAVYPDSDKIGVWPGDRRDDLMVRRESVVDYWVGETGG